ncbi:GTP-binding protein 2-like [Nymphalis io]|uniref:GTP-binding protein 2-like n=2 Tax=Inachis io TaxID=171585 RepID=UPI00216996B7|nr:GTP-binding protein 2-like [Nymphalis io]
MARNCVAPQKSILDTIDNVDEEIKKDEEVAVFPVSCVRGAGLNALHACLLALAPRRDLQRPEDEACEFQIDEIFHVGYSTGPVVGGLLARGRLYEGDEIIIGPLESGEFAEISVRTIYRNRVPCGSVRAGQSASLGLGRFPPGLRQGMLLLARPGGYAAGLSELVHSSQASEKNQKNARRQNKNILQDIANVKNSLTKTSDTKCTNVYVSDDGSKYSDAHVSSDTQDKCVCDDLVFLEDPNDPRRCIYFQASVHVLRHSTAIYPGFQSSVHVGNVRQTAIIEGIMSPNNVLRAGEGASVLFRFARCPEYLVRGRRLLFTAGLGTRAIGRVTQTFPYIP